MHRIPSVAPPIEWRALVPAIPHHWRNHQCTLIVATSKSAVPQTDSCFIQQLSISPGCATSYCNLCRMWSPCKMHGASSQPSRGTADCKTRTPP